MDRRSGTNFYKLTWVSLNGRDTSQIDTVINKKWKYSLQDVRMFRGAHVGNYHFRLMTTVKMKLRKTLFPEQASEQIDVSKLKISELKRNLIQSSLETASVSWKAILKRTVGLAVSGPTSRKLTPKLGKRSLASRGRRRQKIGCPPRLGRSSMNGLNAS